MELGLDTFPFKCDFPISKYFEYKAYEQEYFKFTVDEEQADSGKAMEGLATALSYVTGVTKDEYLEHFPFYVDEKDNELVGDYSIDFGEELSILRVYAHIRTIVHRYKPRLKIGSKDFSFTHKGETYYWDRPLWKDSMRPFPNLPAGVAILVQDFRDLYNEKKKLIQYGGENANHDFNLGQTEIALLCRKKGEKLPMHDGERSKWIDKRSNEFSDIPLSTLLDLRFFLINTLEDWLPIDDMLLTSKAGRPSIKLAKKLKKSVLKKVI